MPASNQRLKTIREQRLTNSLNKVHKAMPALQYYSTNGMLSTISSVVLSMALLCLAEFVLAQQESVVGTTQGELQVDRQGAMNYNIPLTLPRAPAGFQPSLFLSYRSGTKEGLLGQGWQLQGLTVVHRCSGIPAVHGEHKAVTFSQDDVLCIDGNFLVPINDDEYRTAIESFARIQRIDDGFEVLTKTGIHLYYGKEANARVGSSGKTVSWLVNRMQDANGNTIEYAYSDNPQERFIKQIRYAAVVIDFIYEPSNRRTVRYTAGVKQVVGQRLQRITISNEGEEMREYRFRYHPKDIRLHDRLIAVRECARTQGTEWECLSPTLLTWNVDGEQATSQYFEWGFEWALSDVSPQRYLSGDFNGDGFSDIYYASAGSQTNAHDKIYWGNSGRQWNEQELSQNIRLNNDELRNIRVADFNGDGLSDIYHFRYRSNRDVIYLARLEDEELHFDTVDGIDSGTANYPKIDRACVHLACLRIADFNGDGKTDIYHITPGHDRLYLTQSAGEYQVQAGAISFAPGRRLSVADLRRIRVADFNGDALIDVYRVNAQQRDDIFFYDGIKFRHTQAGINSRFIQRDLENEFRRLQIGDFNGDRIADIYYAESNTEQSVYLSDGTGSYVQLPAPALPDVSGAWRDIAPRLQFLDLNGDQATDIYYFHDDTSQDQIWSLAGTQWQTFEAQLGEAEKRGVKDIERVVFLDVNGDGIVDAYTLPAHQYKLANVYWGKFKLPLVVSITNGLGLEQAVTYAPLSTVHVPAQLDERQDPATLFNRTLPLWVVTQQSRLGQVSERYRYHGSQLHTDGFGFLGFSEIWREDVTRGIQERTRYHLKYPYIGKVFSEAQFLIQAQATEASANMDQATLVREKTIVHSHQTYHAGKVLFPHLKTVTQQEYDLAGQWMTSTKEAFEKYDEHGDVNRLVKVTADGKRQFVETTLREYVSHALEPTIRLLKRQAIRYADGVHEEIRHVSEFEYGNGYLPIKKTIQPQHPLSTIQTYRYDRFGNLIYFAVATADDEQSKRATHTLYEPGGRYITAQTNVQGHRQTFVHDPQLQQATLIVDANGREQHNTYDAWGRLRQRHHFDGTVMMIDYSNKQSSLAHPESVYSVREQQQGGMTREYHYDRKQQRMREIVQGMDQEKNIRDYQYDAVGRAIATSLPFQEQDAVKIWTYREYDARDRLLKERTPYPGYHASFTVNYVKNTEYRSNRLNQLQSIIRDGLGRVISVVDAQGSASHFEYDPLGNLLRMSPPDGAETVMQYDVFGNRLSLDSPYRGHWQYRYDAWGQKLSETNIQFKRSYVYDRLGRTIQRQENDAVAEWVYDTAPNGIGHLAEKRFDGHIQKYAYDQYSRLASFADGNYLTQWHYDDANRVARIDYPGGFSVEHEYSLEGYLSRLHLIPAKLSGVPSKPPSDNEMVEGGVEQAQQLPRFKQAQREYQTRRDFYANLAQQEVSSQWRQTLQTAVGEMDTALVQLQKTLPKTMRDYDWPLCRDIAVEKIETATASLSLAQQESLLENRLRRIFIQQLLDEVEIYSSCADTVGNSYASKPDMTSVSPQAIPNTQQRVPLWTVLQRDEFGKAINTRHGNGWETRWLYNVARQAMAIQTSDHRNDLLRDLTYYYDELGNIVDRHDKENDIDEYFNYDELNRLNAATAIHGSQTLRNLSYEYSAGGSIVNHSEHGEYTYNNASAPQQVTSFNGKDYQHDAMGNLVAAGDFSAQWGSMHNPLQMQRGKHKVTHRFDADGHIVARNFSTGKAIYHGGDLYTEIHDGTDINRCGKIYAGKVIAAIYCVKNQQTDQIYYLHRDVLGSVDTVSNQQGRLLARFEYEPFGQRRYQQGQLPIDLGYTGHEHYSELGLIDMKGRWYDPQRGQFLSPDPNIPSPLATQSYHQYSYALNNPLRYNDPSGFFFKNIFKKIGSLFRQVIRFVTQNYRAIITAIASYYAGTLIADSFISTASNQLIWSPGAMASGAYMQAYQNILLQGTMIAGASGAGISSTLAGGNLRQVLIQSLSGGLACVAGACVGGKILTPDRIAANAVLNGVTAMASGGSFKNAALTGLAGGVLRSVALQFRSQQIAQSMLNPENASGLSVGFNGDQFKLGGNRYAYGMEVSGTFGGLQGGQGELLGQSYLSGSWQDHLVEAFAGPHDALNSWYWYDRVGNARPFASPFLRWIGEGINLTNIYLATPFVIASTTPGYFYSLPH